MMTQAPLPLDQSAQPPAYATGAIARPASPLYRAFGLSRSDRKQTLPELLAIVRSRYPGRALIVSQASFDALTAAGCEMAEVSVGKGPGLNEVWMESER